MDPTVPEADFRAFCETGDVGALARVFEALAPELLRVATSLAGDAASGEDLLQATFVTAIERRDRWDAERALVPWLVGLLTRHGRELRRRARREPDAERLSRAEARDPCAAVEARELSGLLGDATERLPENQRQVLTLFLRHDLSPAEIAEALGRSPSTVRTQLQRGLEQLRRRVSGVASVLLPALALAPRGLGEVERSIVEHARRSVANVATEPGLPMTPHLSALPMLSIALATLTAVSIGVLSSGPGPSSATGASAQPPAVRLAAAPAEASAEPAAEPVAEPAARPAGSATRAPASRRAAVAPPAPDDETSGRDERLPTMLAFVVRVLDPSGAPVRRARVALASVRLAETPDSIHGWRAGVVAPDESDAEGEAILFLPRVWNDMHPDGLSFSVDHPEYAPFCSDLVSLADGNASAVLDPGASLVVRTSFADPDVADALPVRLDVELGERSNVAAGDVTRLAADTLEVRGLAPGEHHLVVSARGPYGRRHSSRFASFAVAAGERAELEVELRLVATLHGSLSDDVPRPVTGGEVILHRSAGRERMLARTLRAEIASDGTFTFRDLAPGDVEVAARCDGWTSVQLARAAGVPVRTGRPSDVARNPGVTLDGEAATLVVPMEPAARLDVRLTGPDGRPAPEVVVGVRSAVGWTDGRWSYFEELPGGTTGADGRLHVEDVRPGPGSVSAFHPRLRLDGPIPQASEVALPGDPLAAGERRTVELELVAR